MDMEQKQKYAELRSIEQYYSTWSKESIESLKAGAKVKGIPVIEFATNVYNKYKMRFEVFNRDNFECQSATCKKDSPKLTVHHVRFRRNHGPDKSRNCVALCKPCHARFHSGMPLTIKKDSGSVFAGQTFKEHREHKHFVYDRKETQEIRKENRPREKLLLSRIQMLLMLWFLKYVDVDLENLGKEYKENKDFWDQKSNFYI